MPHPALLTLTLGPQRHQVGAEYEGVSDAAAARANVNVRIPMSGAMEG